jgi:hypothetical protein
VQAVLLPVFLLGQPAFHQREAGTEVGEYFGSLDDRSRPLDQWTGLWRSARTEQDLAVDQAVDCLLEPGTHAQDRFMRPFR